MEQHPIPQNIQSYEFRLVGDMTLRQFFQLAGGIIVGLLIFRTEIIGIVKYPLIGISVFTGVAMAFIPLNGRPFGRWIVAFLKAIYSPTEYVWMAPSATTIQAPSTVQATTPIASPSSTPAPVAEVVPVAAIPIPAEPTPQIETPPTQTSKTLFVSVAEEKPSTHTSSEEHVTPTPTNTQALPEETNSVGWADVTPQYPSQPTAWTPPTIPAGSPATNTTKVASPENPNILTGIVTNPAGDPLENAIIEIIDTKSGIPARALRTNKTGTFQIVTPLQNGTYTIQTEKDGFTFDTVNIEAKSGIIEPIYIQGQVA